MRKLILNEEISDLDVASDNAVSDILMTAINKRYELISDMQSISITMQDEGYEDMTEVISSIISEDESAIGKLQELIEILRPSLAVEIEGGKEEASELMDGTFLEGLRNESNIKKGVKKIEQNDELNEDVDDEFEDEDNQWYVSYYEEYPMQGKDYYEAHCNLVDYIEYASEDEAVEALNSLGNDLKSDGFVKIRDDFWIKRSKYIGEDSFYMVEHTLGSEEL